MKGPEQLPYRRKNMWNSDPQTGSSVCWAGQCRLASKHSLFLNHQIGITMGTQNHRMSGESNPLLKQITQDLVQEGSEYLQRRLYNLSGQPVPGLCHPQHKEGFPYIQMKLPVFQVVPVAPYPVAGNHRIESSPILLTPACKVCTMYVEWAVILLEARKPGFINFSAFLNGKSLFLSLFPLFFFWKTVTSSSSKICFLSIPNSGLY